MTLVPSNSRTGTGATGPAGGDLDGTYPDPTLDAIVAATGPLGTTVRTPAVTIDTKGRVTALTDQAIAFPADAVASVFGRSGAVVAAANDYAIGDINGAAAAIGGVIWTTVTKAGDESITNNTLQADNDLFFTPASGGVYELQLFIVYASPAGAGTPDFKLTFGEDGTVRGVIVQQAFLSVTDAAQAASAGAAINNGSLTAAGTAAANRALIVNGWYLGNGAQAGLWWAQNTTDANATVVRAGSLLRYRRIV